MEHAESVTINTPAEEVWAFVGDIRWWPRWVDDISEVELVADEPTSGSEVSYKWRGNDARATISEYEPGQKIGISSAEKSYDFHESITLRPHADRTEVVFVMGFVPTAWWTRALSILMQPFKRSMLGRPLRKELASLRTAVEAGASVTGEGP